MEGCCLQVQERIVFHAPFVPWSLLQLSLFLRDWQDLLHSPPMGPQSYICGVKLLPSKDYLCTDGFQIIIFILQAYLNPTSKPTIVLPCLVPNLITSSLCLDEFSSKMKEPDVPVWGKGREIERQRTERRCPGLASGSWLCWDRAQSSLSNGLAIKPGCLLLMTFLVTSQCMQKQEEEKQANAARRLCLTRVCIK